MSDIKNINEWEVLTPSGWSNFSGIKKSVKDRIVKIVFEDETHIECSTSHKLKLKDGIFKYASEIKKGMILRGKDDIEKVVKSKKVINKKSDLYDLLNVEKNQEFFSNDVISHNCAFIDGIEEIWLSSQSTLSTGGKAIILSTPNGVGNFFHKTWTEAEAKRNKFNTIKLHWNLHPERDQKWRDEQTALLGPKGAAQECDCDFATSGNTVIDVPILDFYKESKVRDPIEMRGVDRGLWIWEYPDYSRNYIVAADVARGDGNDFSAFHIFDVETVNQVAEYKGKIGTKEYGNLLVNIATEYNNSLLVVENLNVGWGVIQQIIDRDYQNLFYSSADLQYVDVEQQMTNRLNNQDKKMTPGFTTTSRTRPVMISKMEMYFREKSVGIQSKRCIDELYTFIWNNNKQEAMRGYNDDLVLSLCIGLWVRDTALRLRQQSIDLTRNMLGNIDRVSTDKKSAIYTTKSSLAKTAWEMPVGVKNHQKEGLTWLL